MSIERPRAMAASAVGLVVTTIAVAAAPQTAPTPQAMPTPHSAPTPAPAPRTNAAPNGAAPGTPGAGVAPAFDSSTTTVFEPAPVSVALASLRDEAGGPPPMTVKSSSSLLAIALDRHANYDKQAVAPGSMEAMSLFAVRSPEERKFTRHDLVQIVVREQSKAKSEQELDTKKDYTIAAEVAWANFSFDAFGQPGVATSSGAHDAPVFEAIGKKKLKGEGDYNRTDEFTTRMTAEVIEVLPNGNLILEARTTIANDKEVTSIKLTGICRPDDVTSANTVLSNQIHDLKIEKMNTGFVKDAADKGIIAQVLDAVLAF